MMTHKPEGNLLLKLKPIFDLENAQAATLWL